MKHMREVLRLRLQGFGTRAIAKSCNVGRTTVQDFLHRVESSGLSVAESLELPEVELLERIGRRKTYSGWTDEQRFFEYVSRELTKPSLTLMLLWEEYREQSSEGYSYSSFCARYGEWRKRRRVWMHQEHRAGDKVFVDYCGDSIAIICPDTGEICKASVFVAVLGASNYVYAQVTARQDIEGWISAQVRTFEYFGGVTKGIVPDNAKSVVKTPSLYDPECTLSYAEFARHYQVAVLPTRVRHPQDKGKVEVGVQIVQRWIIARLRRQQFFSLGEANSAIWGLLDKLNDKTMRGYGVSRRQLFNELEKPLLSPLPLEPFVFGIWKQARVGVNYHVEYDKNFYSVPCRLTREMVQVKATNLVIEIYHQGEQVALHHRLSGRHQYTTISAHMPEAHQRYSEWDQARLTSWAISIGAQTALMTEKLFASRPHPEQAIRAVLGLLSLARRYGKERLEAACTKANQLGAVSMTNVSNILKSGRDQQPQQDTLSPSVHTVHGNIRGGTYYH